MQATEHRLSYDGAPPRQLDRTRLRCILIERAMRPRPMIVFQKSEDDPFEVGFIQHMTWSRHSLRIEPISRSTCPFCQGERGAMG